MSCSIQVQTVLYGNEKVNLFRSLDSIFKAAENCRKENGKLDKFVVSYGDATDEPLYSQTEIAEITEKYKEQFEFKYTFFNENTGSAKGQTMQGMKAETDYILVINPDVVLSPRFFVTIMEPFSDPDVGIADARQCPVEHPKEYDVNTKETAWAMGACFAIATQLFKQVEGFDYKTFFLYCDDVDLSFRVRLLGKKIIYQPLAPFFHAKRVSVQGNWQPPASEVYYSAEAALFMAYKWSYPRLLKRNLKFFKNSGDENLLKAANEFERRRAEGTLPEPLDKNHSVAKFSGNNYAVHRFSL